ncbi:ABC transporter ATP-binding protein [Aneurinibacillus sp. REN35]|uniref:ABC transporter ATP-binding protein n=1 Tax=Aneurinibacillus sp. REN35 TaxID=3237286 RepID=UPI003526E559
MSLLQVKNVTKRFKGLVAVSNVSLTLERGEILGLIGPNGAGKTTLFSSICGYHVPEEGEVWLNGKEIRGKKPEFICKEGVARTFQIVQPFGNLTLLENTMVGAFNRVRKREEAQALALEKLAFVGLEKKKDIRMKDLTFVEQKKVEMARALASQPALLFLDEVMSGLNPTEVEEVIGLIRKIRDGGTSIFFIEHLMAAVMALSDRVLVMHHGEKIAEGKPEEVTKDAFVIEAYLGGAL